MAQLIAVGLTVFGAVKVLTVYNAAFSMPVFLCLLEEILG